jgi:hypothetical protein
MDIEKEKLPKGFSYPLKSSILENVLQENNISTYVQLNYIKSKIFFDAHYWLPNNNVDYDRFYIRVGCLDSSKHKEAVDFMQKIVLKDFIIWAKKLLSAPKNSLLIEKYNYFVKDFEK